MTIGIRSKADQTAFQGYETNIMDKVFVKRAIFNEMRPVKVSKIGKDWELKGIYFKSNLKKNAQDKMPWSYTEGDKKIGFEHKQMKWDTGEIVKTGVNSVDGNIEELSINYKDAISPGIDIKIVQDNYKFQKIVKIDSLASLGVLPAEAEYLEIDFEFSGDFGLPNGQILDRLPFGENSFIQPVRAWDKSETPEDPKGEIKSGATGIINGNIITKRIPVSWLKQAVFPVFTDTTITYGSENTFNEAFTSHLSVAALDSTHFVVGYSDGGSLNYGIARIGVVSGVTISSYGAENIFNSAATQYISVAALDSTHFVVGYRDEGGDTYGIARVGLVSGVTISSYGAENIFNSAVTDYISIAGLDSTHFVVGYRDDGGDDYGICRVGLTNGGTTISSYGAENIFNSADSRYISIAGLDSTHFVVGYRDIGGDDYGIARVGLVSGVTISSYGAENIFNSAVTYYISVAGLDSTHFVVGYQDFGGDDYGIARVGLVSGVTISSYGTENIFNSVATQYISIAGLDSTHFVVGYRDVGGDNYGGTRVGVVSGVTISEYGAENLFNSASTSHISATALDSSHFVVIYRDDGNSFYGTGIVGSIPVAGWTGKINGVTDPAKINGVAVVNIAKVLGV